MIPDRTRYYPAMTDARIGTTLCGKYRLDKVLGEGGMGVVYAATHLRIGRRVAIKFLHGPALKNEGVVQRFFAEARAAGSLRHPNVIDVLDLESEAGVPFMVLEFLEGEPLSARIARAPRLTLQELQSIFAPILDALAAAHAAGIVHRDLKPDNIFLSRVAGELVPKLLDFGIAKLRDGGSATNTGTLLGTPMYMSPEQARGAMREIGPATDIWAMGVVLFECVTGESPFGFEAGISPFAQVARIATEAPRSLRVVQVEAAAELIATVDGALQPKAADRFESAHAMRSTLLGKPQTLAASPASLPPTLELSAPTALPRTSYAENTRPLAPTQLIEPARLRGLLALGAAALVLLLAGIAGAALWLTRPSPPEPVVVEPVAVEPVAVEPVAVEPAPQVDVPPTEPVASDGSTRVRVLRTPPTHPTTPPTRSTPAQTRTGEWNTDEL